MNARHALRHCVYVFVAFIGVAVAAQPGRADDDRSETRSVSGFDRVRLEGGFTTTIMAGKATERVVVSGAPDVVGRVTTEVHGRELVIGTKPGLSFASAPKITIALPVLRRLLNAGAGSVTIAGLTGEQMDIENDGAASITASGRAASVTITLNGAGKIDTTSLNAGDVTVDSNGVGSVRVRASGDLAMSVNGVGEIRYVGNPSHIESHVNGIGRIGRL